MTEPLGLNLPEHPRINLDPNKETFTIAGDELEALVAERNEARAALAAEKSYHENTLEESHQLYDALAAEKAAHANTWKLNVGLAQAVDTAEATIATLTQELQTLRGEEKAEREWDGLLPRTKEGA